MQTISHVVLTFLVNALWQIPMMAAVAWLACLLLSRNPASHRHAIWIIALAASLVLPVVSVRSASRVEPSGHIVPGVPSLGASTTASVASGRARTAVPVASAIPRRIEFGSVVAAAGIGIYLLFVMLRLGRFAAQILRTARIRKSSETIAAAGVLRAVWTRTERALGVAGVELRVSDSLPGPVTAGILRKTIILPRQLAENDSESVLMAAIGHEMAHIARRDFLINVLCECLWLPIAFHPASWLIRRGVSRTREIATDELVTSKLLNASLYAESIFAIASNMSALPQPGLTLGVFDGDFLEERIKRLTRAKQIGLRSARVLLASTICALLGCVVYVSGFAVPVRAQSPGLSEIKQGVDAYNGGYYSFAEDHFRKAIEIDPNNVNARLFLARTILATTRTSVGVDHDALFAPVIEQFDQVLLRDPMNEGAILGLATLARSRSQQAHDLLLKLIAAEPNDKDALYTAAVVDWQQAYTAMQEAFKQAGLARTIARIPDTSVRAQLRDRWQPTIEEGVKFAKAALALDPTWSDPMAYMNLLDRISAAIADTDEESVTLFAQADDFVGQALAAHKAHANGLAGPKPLAVDQSSASIMTAPFAPAPPPPPPPHPPVQ